MKSHTPANPPKPRINNTGGTTVRIPKPQPVPGQRKS